MSKKLIEVNDLSVHFHTKKGVVKAVNGVSFSIEKGKTLGVVGESGCGKSITSMAIMQLIAMPPGKIESGEIIFEGENLLNKKNEEMRRIRGNKIAMIFQEPMTSLNPVFTIGKQIAEPLIIHKEIDKKQAREKAIDLLKLVGIPRAEKIVDEYPHQLSGGMRQRVMIAMSLACDPQLLIADEPTTALDVTIQAQILKLMNGLKEKFETAIMLITHDLGVIAEMADDVVVMYAGQVMEETTVEEIFDNPKHPYTIGLLNSTPDIEQDTERLANIPGVVPNPIFLPEGCPFNPRCERAMEICSKECPSLKSYGGHKVRCFAVEMDEEEQHE
ncbi:ABC transporter ATP-binding protein [Clostridium sp.]|uniref:ABC transporter ATP-binding protein n=1 Tax=Clostridium sp. TaxID=1506 RepID=UPI003217FFA1